MARGGGGWHAGSRSSTGGALDQLPSAPPVHICGSVVSGAARPHSPSRAPPPAEVAAGAGASECVSAPATAADTPDNPWFFSFVNQLATAELAKMAVPPPPQPVLRASPGESECCQSCVIIRVGGGYLVAGYGQFCVGCNNKIDVQLGGEAPPPPPDTSLAMLTEQAVREVAAEIVAEVVAMETDGVAHLEKAADAAAAALMADVVSRMAREIAREVLDARPPPPPPKPTTVLPPLLFFCNVHKSSRCGHWLHRHCNVRNPPVVVLATSAVACFERLQPSIAVERFGFGRTTLTVRPSCRLAHLACFGLVLVVSALVCLRVHVRVFAPLGSLVPNSRNIFMSSTTTVAARRHLSSPIMFARATATSTATTTFVGDGDGSSSDSALRNTNSTKMHLWQH
jgi:hypothetical protein